MVVPPIPTEKPSPSSWPSSEAVTSAVGPMLRQPVLGFWNTNIAPSITKLIWKFGAPQTAVFPLMATDSQNWWRVLAMVGGPARQLNWVAEI
jgi:hypothetical protein